MPVLLIATLDTKGRELAFVRDRLVAAGLKTMVLDAGSVGPPIIEADISRDELFRRAGTNADEIRETADRGHAVSKAAEGAAAVAAGLAAEGRLDGVFSLGGSAGTTIGTAAMRAVPFGVPKVMVSTLASGQTRPFVAGSDIMLVPSIVDVAGLNALLRNVLLRAADALAGMVKGRFNQTAEATESDRPVVAATMFGVTTPCVDRARQLLEDAGCEVLVFHATGVGGQAMEALIRDGRVDAVLDLTTTELADELVGGVLSAGPERLEAAGRKGIPQVVSVGALDMVNFGPMGTVPERFRSRRLHVHNANVTLMRTTPEENTALGRHMAAVLSKTIGPTTVVLPLGGVSAIDVPGRAFHDPEADRALFDAIRSGLAGATNVQLIERPEPINDPAFADTVAGLLLSAMGRDRTRLAPN
jgi:uncharacterized protein (UPF0261 family)